MTRDQGHFPPGGLVVSMEVPRGIQPGLGDKEQQGGTQKKARGGLCCGYFSDHEQERLHRFPEVPKAGSSRGG